MSFKQVALFRDRTSGGRPVFNVFSYENKDDTLAEVTAPDYFDRSRFQLEEGAIINALLSDGYYQLEYDMETETANPKGASSGGQTEEEVSNVITAITATGISNDEISGSIRSANQDNYTRAKIIEQELLQGENNDGKYGFLGNGVDANVVIDISLSGKYTVECLLKPTDASAANRFLDFRANGGTGYISISGNTVAYDSGTPYVNNVQTGTFSNNDLKLVQLKGIDIDCTSLTMLSGWFSSDYVDGLISDVRIFDYYTGELLHRFLCDEKDDVPVYDDVTGVTKGVINNYYTGFSSYFSDSYVVSDRWLARQVSQKLETDCMITHDDGYVEMETIVAPLLEQYGYVANIGIVKDYVEGTNPAFMRESEVVALAGNYGFGMVNHTTSHQSIAALYEVDPQDASDEITGCQDYLNALGLDGDYLIYALSNSYSPATRLLSESLGIKVARIPSVSGNQKMPPDYFTKLTPIGSNSIQIESTLDSVLEMIDSAVINGQTIITYNHNVKSDQDALDEGYVNVTGITFYTQMITRLNGVNANTMTMKDWYSKYSVLP